jgi:hypothetical protein
MADSCTILIALEASCDALSVIEHCVPTAAKVRVERDATSWSQAIVSFGSSTSLTFNKRVRIRAGDEFSRMVLGMHNYFRNVETHAVRTKKMVLDLIAECKLALGVVVEPSFDTASGSREIICNVARECGAIIWNGSALLDPDGRLLLDADGASEVE